MSGVEMWGVELSGVEMSGVEFSGVEMSNPLKTLASFLDYPCLKHVIVYLQHVTSISVTHNQHICNT